jgi:ATP-dependent helicase HepA
MEFLSWEAPLVQGVNDMLLGGELGNTAISSIKLKGIPAGTILVECFYVMQVSAPKKYQVTRFLPPAPVRVLMDDAGRDLTAVVNHEQLNRLCEKIRKTARMAIIKQIRDSLEKVLSNVEKAIQTQQQSLKSVARAAVADVVGEEIQRLEHLREINPSIREEELAFFYAQRDGAIEHIEQAFLDFQAVRVIITI